MDLASNSEYWSQTFKALDCAEQTIASIEFDSCTFEECNFSDAIFDHCNFVDCEFTNCNLSNVDMAYSKFADVLFRDSKLVGVQWTKVTWPSLLTTSPVSFVQCLLSDSSFFGLNLQELLLDGCRANRVDFRDGDFSNADFAATDFSGAQFGNTNLTGVNFVDATDYDIDLAQNTISGAKFSRYEAVNLLNSLDIELHD